MKKFALYLSVISLVAAFVTQAATASTILTRTFYAENYNQAEAYKWQVANEACAAIGSYTENAILISYADSNGEALAQIYCAE